MPRRVLDGFLSSGHIRFALLTIVYNFTHTLTPTANRHIVVSLCILEKTPLDLARYFVLLERWFCLTKNNTQDEFSRPTPPDNNLCIDFSYPAKLPTNCCCFLQSCIEFHTSHYMLKIRTLVDVVIIKCRGFSWVNKRNV